jgi:hypothetical protein
MGGSRRSRIGTGAFVTVSCLLLVLSGCAALRRIQVFQVSIVNDTAAPVVVRGCDDFCSSSLLTFELQPGASVVINRTTNMHKRFSVTTPGGGHIGCVDLYFKRPEPGTSVPVSASTACPHGSRVPWTLLGVGAAAALLVVAVLAWASRRRRSP